MHEQLADERVVERRDRRPGVDPGVEAHAGRQHQLGDEPGAGRGVVERVLGVQAGLDRPAGRTADRVESLGPLTRPEAQHPLDEIDATHQLGHPMFDLETGVDLEEPRLAAVVAVEGVGVDDELDGADRSIVDRFGEGPRRSPAAGRGDARRSPAPGPPR